VSVSLTSEPVIVSVHDSFAAKSLLGSSVKVTGPQLAVAVCGPLVAQEIVYHGPLGMTLSLKVTKRFAPTATPVPPLAGVVLVTDGG
jgi:hypothetical protein